ncbi:hypothetical protein BDW22DRAFT_1349630 [Trametopsis cervina]|nr:hypothetical protein BDW22DRAFT_1349630 [Trametopsis cervina]
MFVLTRFQDSGCLGKVHGLKARLQHSVISEKLIIIDDIKPDPTHTGPASVHSGHKPQHPVLNIAVAKAIERVLSEATAPHFIESSQNSEDKIKSLFKPVLRSLGLEDILVTK